MSYYNQEELIELENKVTGLAEQVKQLRDELALAKLVIKHCWIHEGYSRCGYKHMTTKEKDFFDGVIKMDVEQLLDATK